jgi:hypothetical protein
MTTAFNGRESARLLKTRYFADADTECCVARHDAINKYS